MNRDETAGLVNRIVSTWPTGPKGHIWTEVLGDLDRDLAETAYRRLRAEHERPPAAATFLATYGSLDRRAPQSAAAAAETDEAMPLSDPRAAAAFERGYRQGRHELWLLSKGRLGTPPDHDGDLP